jgi:hypothetical protein
MSEIWASAQGPFFEHTSAAHKAPLSFWLHTHRQLLLWSAATVLSIVLHWQDGLKRAFDGLRWGFSDVPLAVVCSIALSDFSVVLIDSMTNHGVASAMLAIVLFFVQGYHLLAFVTLSDTRIGTCLFLAFLWVTLFAKTLSFVERRHGDSLRSPSSSSSSSSSVSVAGYISAPLFRSQPDQISYLGFLFHPSLVYHRSVPRLPHLRWHRAFSECTAALGSFLVAHLMHCLIVMPVLASPLSVPLQVLVLAVPCHVTFVLCFYGFWYCCMSAQAELLRLADRRHFFGAWFAEARVAGYFRSWSLPVHHWLREHVARPVSRRLGRMAGTTAAFLFSALVHELVVYGVVHRFSVPFIGIMLLLVSAVMVVEQASGHFVPSWVLPVCDFVGHVACYIVCAPAVRYRMGY